MSTPVRIQLSRRRGWRMPPNTVIVARPSKWGNPFKPGELTVVWHRPGTPEGWPVEPVYRDTFMVLGVDHAVRLFRSACKGRDDWYHENWRLPEIAELRGKNLACWCKSGEPCHADVLLEIANGEGA